jgi:hypothetical protein
MKKTIITLTLIALWFSACSSPAGNATVPSTEADFPLPIAEPLDLEQEWQIVYKQATVLSYSCHMIDQAHRGYTDGIIGLERARYELDALAGFVSSAQEELSILTTPSDAFAPYLLQLEERIPALIIGLEAGDISLSEKEGAVWNGVQQACFALDLIWDKLSGAALSAGLTQDTILQFQEEIVQAGTKVYESTMGSRSAADAPGVTSTSINSPPAEITGGDQEQLKDTWRPAYHLGALLFETCTMTYNTHADYGQGIIGLDRARTELEAESNFVEYVLRGITSIVPESEQVAAHIIGIETQVYALVEWLGSEDLGAGGAEEAINRSCISLQSQMDKIYNQAQSAGINSATLDELDSELSPMINDLYDQTWFGR